MPGGRFFHPSSLNRGEEVLLHDEEMKHLIVLRPALEDHVEIVNGKGVLADAVIYHLTRHEARLKIVKLHKEPPPCFRLILAQALPKMPKLDFIVEKGTELGMTDLFLFPGALSEKKALTENERQRIHSLMVSSMKQCGRLYLPIVEFYPHLVAWPKSHYPAFFGDLSPTAPPFEAAWRNHSPSTGVFLAIGPEKGFSYDEVKRLKELSFQGVRLHPNVLRTETAACAMLALASHFLIDTVNN
jgi:16S rRNA (uracil1498-N3)-methyltransferase